VFEQKIVAIFFAGSTLSYPLAPYLGCANEAYMSTIGAWPGCAFTRHMGGDLVFGLIITRVFGVLSCLGFVHLS
jgi:hypothetical protein